MSCGGFLLVFGEHLVPSLFYAELGGSLGFSLDKPLSDFWEKREGHCEATEIFSVFVQGDKCIVLFSYSLHKREWTLMLKLCIWP